MLVETEELRLLAEIGMIAMARRDARSAQAIFAALEQERPDAAAPYVGMALTWLNAGEPALAIDCLQRGLKAVAPAGQGELHALLGLALKVEGRGAESVRALQAAGDVPLAKALLARLNLAPMGG